MQEKLNYNFYKNIIKQLDALSLKSTTLDFKDVSNRFDIIMTNVLKSDWGLQGNLTKKQLIIYLNTLNNVVYSKGGKKRFLWIYMFDKEVRLARKKLSKQFKKDFGGDDIWHGTKKKKIGEK